MTASDNQSQNHTKQTNLRRVIYFGTYRNEYSRNRIMLESLRQASIEVVECHASLWVSIEDRVEAAKGKWFSFDFLRRLISAYTSLISQYLSASDHDIVVLGYPGQLDVFLARILTWMRRKPLVLDVFMSIYLIALERGLDKGNTLNIQLLKLLESAALRLPDQLIQDTESYVDWLVKTYHLNKERFRLIPTGADDRIFHPMPNRSPDGLFRAIYYGTFIPNHRVAYIIEASRLLKDRPEFVFELIGSGPDYNLAAEMIEEYKLQDQVKLMGWMSQSELIERMAQANVCLGAFGFTPQSLMTVQNKIYEGMAMERVVVTGDSPIIHKNFENGVHLITCDRTRPESLANALIELRENPEQANLIAQQGLRKFQQEYSIRQLGNQFTRHLQDLVD